MITQIHEEVFIGTDFEINRRIHELIKKRRKKPKVLFLVDNHNWCWSNTARSIAAHLPQFEFKILSAKEWRKDPRSNEEWADMVYMRGYPWVYLDGERPLVKPYIFTIPTGGENLALRIEQSKAYKDTAFACVVQNNAAKAELEKAGFRNVHVIPNGVDTELFKPTDAVKKYRVGFAGNNEGCRAELKGTGLVKSACESMGVSYYEVTKGNRFSYEQMPDFYNSIRIYAQPSESEGCSNSVMEAMSCGIPCMICLGIGYHGEICEHSEVLFVPRDVNQIARGIRFLDDNELYQGISKNARAFAMRHSWDKIAPVHGKLIDAALAMKKLPEPVPVPPVDQDKKLKDVREICCLCKYFFPLRDVRDCGLCMKVCESMVFKYKSMTCENFKGKE